MDSLGIMSKVLESQETINNITDAQAKHWPNWPRTGKAPGRWRPVPRSFDIVNCATSMPELPELLMCCGSIDAYSIFHVVESEFRRQRSRTMRG